MFIQNRVFLSFVLGILIPVVCSNGVITIKSNSLTFLDPSRSGESSSIAGTHRWRRALPTPDEILNITSLHNSLRSLEGASNMEYLRWNPLLADLAQKWADRCDFSHGQPSYNNSVFPYSSLGQNLYATTGKLTFRGAIRSAWYNEKPSFDYDTVVCQEGKVCGHYTQVVWATSYEVGCASAFCSVLKNTKLKNSTNFVCNYGPAGNYIGAQPYVKGKACSQCSTGVAWCTDGLCNRECKKASRDCQCQTSCQHCGTSNDISCTCSCKPGWTGPDCSVECKNTDSRCNSGWPPHWCDHPTIGFVIRNRCPVMCKLCKVANGTDFSACDAQSEHSHHISSFMIRFFLTTALLTNLI